MLVWVVVGLVVLVVLALAVRSDLRRRRVGDLGEKTGASGWREVRAENERRAETWGRPPTGRPDGGVGNFQ